MGLRKKEDTSLTRQAVEYSSTGMILPDDWTYDQWASHGQTLSQIHSGFQWWVGDWINHGKGKWGEKYKEALRQFPEAAIQTLYKYAEVAEIYDFSNRLLNISWTHHFAAAYSDDRHELLQQAVDENLSVAALRQRAYALKLAGVADREPGAISGVYDVIVIDPPWPMEKIQREVAPNQREFEYPTMQEEELAELEIPCSDECHMWLWTTHRFLPMAMRLLDAWDFTYVCTFVWHKPGGFQPFGLPQYNCEFALYARHGSPQFVDTTDFNVCFDAPRGAHSAKPEDFYDMVRRVTAGRRIDMFNRRPIDGFDVWGKEASVEFVS